MQSREFSKERIVRCIEKVLANRNIDLLTQEAYTFIHLHCGSIAHFSIDGWKHTYRDLRDFLHFFLVKNEYGSCLVDPPEFMNLTSENREIILSIVKVCQKYNDQIMKELQEREAQASVLIGKKLLSGELSIRELFRRRSEIEAWIHLNQARKIDRSGPELIGEVVEIGSPG